MLKVEITIEFLGKDSTLNPIRRQLLEAYLLARKLELFVSLAWCCFAQKIVAKMMTPVTSHLFLPELISEMPPGSAEDILYGQTDPSASLHL